MPRVDGRVDAQGELFVSSDELIASARRAQPGVGKQFLEGLILHDVVHHLGQFCHHHGGNVRERCVCAARRRLAATTVRSGLRAAPASKPASPDLCQTHVHVAVDEPLEYGHVADGTPNRTRSILLARSSRRDGLRRGLPPRPVSPRRPHPTDPQPPPEVPSHSPCPSVRLDSRPCHHIRPHRPRPRRNPHPRRLHLPRRRHPRHTSALSLRVVRPSRVAQTRTTRWRQTQPSRSIAFLSYRWVASRSRVRPLTPASKLLSIDRDASIGFARIVSPVGCRPRLARAPRRFRTRLRRGGVVAAAATDVGGGRGCCARRAAANRPVRAAR